MTPPERDWSIVIALACTLLILALILIALAGGNVQ